MIKTDIRLHWGWVEPLLLKHGGAWSRPESVLAECMQGSADFFLVDEGFIVLCETTHRQTGTVELFVWWAIGKGRHLFRKYEPDIMAEAKYRGISTVYTRVSARGMLRICRGWQTRHVELFRRV